jgi:preprotein translocase subunit SecG
MIFYLLTTLYVLVCFGMMLVVYLQQGKGGDIASAFGGASSQTAFGARSGATVLSRATWICAALFIVGALALGMMGRGGSSSSVLGGRTPLTQPSGPTPSPLAQPVPAPAAPTPSQNAPATPAPSQNAPAQR